MYIKKLIHISLIAGLVFLTLSCSREPKSVLINEWDTSIQRNFVGSSFWANRLQDWQMANGRIECIIGKDPWRTVHILTHEINNSNKSFQMEVNLGLLHDTIPQADAFAGLLLGAGSLDLDYRARCLIFNRPNKNGGILAGINGNGELVIMDMDNGLEPIAQSVEPISESFVNNENGYIIQVKAKLKNDFYKITNK